MPDQDRGQGDIRNFPAEDLEKLYTLGGVDIASRIQGNSLNKILGVKRYDPDTWYLVTAKGVEKL